jgi:hypothetical protein
MNKSLNNSEDSDDETDFIQDESRQFVKDSKDLSSKLN